MNITQRKPIAIALFGVLFAFSSFGNEALAQRAGGRHHGPPPEAYTACEGKSDGDTAEFQSPRGDTVTGTCEPDGGRLVLRPDNPPDRPETKNAND